MAVAVAKVPWQICRGTTIYSVLTKTRKGSVYTGIAITVTYFLSDTEKDAMAE